MAIIRQTGHTANAGRVTTTMGLREPRPPVCTRCRERRENVLYTIDPNGQIICGECSGSIGAGVLKGVCDPDNCACGKDNDEPDPS